MMRARDATLRDAQGSADHDIKAARAAWAAGYRLSREAFDARWEEERERLLQPVTPE